MQAEAVKEESRSKGASNRREASLMRMLRSALHVAEIQFQIVLTRLKIAALRVAVFAALGVAAILLAILAIIFLYIGVFKVLTDVIGIAPVWAFLIFGVLHLVLAAGLAYGGIKYLTADDNKDEDDTPNQPVKSAEPASLPGNAAAVTPEAQAYTSSKMESSSASGQSAEQVLREKERTL